MINVQLKSIKKINNNSKLYDIQTKNRNYYANGLLVHNSLIKTWFDASWHISTNGTIDAFKAPLNSIKHPSYGDLFIDALPDGFEEFLDEDYTYMFELTSPENRVVIPYDETKIYFLGLRNNKTLVEEFPDNHVLTQFFNIPKRYNLHSLKEVIAASEALPWNEEGYVVCDNEFNRVKIKSPKYVSAHYLRSNNTISYERLLDVVREGEEAEFLIYASDYKEYLEKVKAIYNNMIFLLKEEMKIINPDMFATRKDYALEVLKRERWMQGFLFKYDSVDEVIKSTPTDKWIEWMKLRGDLSEGE